MSTDKVKEYEELHHVVARNGNVTHNSALELFNLGMGYFQWCDDNPKVNQIPIRTGKRAGQVDTFTTPRPYTVKGLCLYCNILEDYFQDVRKTQTKNSDYYICISKLLYIIYVQNQELATTGVYNAQFVSRLLNMDKDETPPVHAIKVELVAGLPPLSSSESEILDKLEQEGELFTVPKL